MNKTIVVFGSSTGTCESIAEKIASRLGAEVMNVQDLTADIVAANVNLILGTSTWGAGEMQDDWYEGIKNSGAQLVGAVSTDGYTFDDSAAIVNGKFVGLPLDDVNEDDKTDGRIDSWVAQISPNL